MEPLDEFQVNYPCYFFVTKSSIVYKNGKAVGFRPPLVFGAVESDDGRRALAVFTDQDLAERFLSAEGLEGLACIFAKDAEEFLRYLETAAKEMQLVVFDPEASHGWTSRIWPIQHAITQTKDQKGLR